MENYHFNAVAAESAEVRGAFIRKTYAHLAGALLAFVLLETVFLGMFRDVAISFAGWALNGFNWLIVIGLFAGGSWVVKNGRIPLWRIKQVNTWAWGFMYCWRP